MAFSAARRTLASRLSHHLSLRLHPSLPHLLPSHDPPNTKPSPTPQPPRNQALNLLPFALHLAPSRGFSSSSSSSSGEVDVAGVLKDATEAAATSAAPAPAPFPGEVAAAASDSFFPVAALQHLIDAVHSFTGLNWWACIALTTVLIRSATLPLLLDQMRSTVKLNAMRPEMEVIKAEMQDSMDPRSMQEGKKKMDALFKNHGVTPFTPLKGMFIQGPIFMSFFFAIRNMVEKVPSLKGGGTFWFTDLTTPDDLYIFPVLTLLTFLATVELNMQEGMEGNPMAKKMKTFSRGMAVMTVPFTMTFPKALFCYWITSNMFSLVYGFAIRKPSVKKYLNVPDIAPQRAPAQQPTFNFFSGPKAIPPVDSPISTNRPQQSSSGQSNSSVLSHRIRNLEKKAKSRGKSRRRR